MITRWDRDLFYNSSNATCSYSTLLYAQGRVWRFAKQIHWTRDFSHITWNSQFHIYSEQRVKLEGPRRNSRDDCWTFYKSSAVANYQRLRLPRLSLAQNFNARSPQSRCVEIKQLEVYTLGCLSMEFKALNHKNSTGDPLTRNAHCNTKTKHNFLYIQLRNYSRV